MMHESITKCPKCGKTYDTEYERLGEGEAKRTKHLKTTDFHSFQDAWGTQYAWTITVTCKCGHKYTFSDST
jgi:sarcosine oxidase delta subunit